MSVLRARTALDASAISSSRSPDHSGFFEHLNDSKLNYSISNYGYIYDEEREKLKLEIKELKDMVEMQELERLKLLKRIEEERNSKREEKKALFKQIEKLKRDAKESSFISTKENLTASSLNILPDTQEKNENPYMADSLKVLKHTAESERRQESTLITQLDEMWQLQVANVTRQLQDERQRNFLYAEKIEVLTESKKKFKGQVTELTRELEEARKNIELLKGQNNTLHLQVEQYASQSKNYSDRISMLESQSEHHQQEIAHRQSELEQTRKHYSDTIPKMSEKDQQNMFLKTQLNELDIKFQKMVQTDQRKLKDKDVELKGYKNKVSELEEKNVKLEEDSIELHHAVRTLEAEVKQKEILVIQAQQNLQQTTSHVERLEIELKKSKELQAKATIDAEVSSRSLTNYSTQVETSFNTQIDQLRQLQQKHTDFLIQSSDVTTKLYNVINQITLQISESEEVITTEQFKDMEECVNKLDGLFGIVDHPYITKIFDRLLAQNANSVKEQSKDQQVELNSKLGQLNKLLKGEQWSSIAAREDVIKSKLNGAKSKLADLHEFLYGLEHEERHAAIMTGYEKILALSTILEELSEHIKHLSNFVLDSPSSNTITSEGSLMDTREKTTSKSNKKRVSIGTKKTVKTVSSKDIDRQLPQIMDNIYSSLIFKNTQQRIQYYKERDETINQYKEQASESSRILNETTLTITNDIKKRTADVQAVFTMFEQLLRMRKLKEEKLVQHIKSLQTSVTQLETENEQLHEKEEEIFMLKKQLRERDQKLSKLNRFP